MEIAKIVCAGIIAAVLSIIIKRHNPELALLISLAGCVLIFFMALPRLGAALKLLERFALELGAQTPYVDIVFKIIGVAYLSEFGAQICADAGESAIASKIELAGKILIMVISTPVMLALLELLVGIMP
ncbi:MAG: stage III sporulation protein AD [Clostridiales bacterium]|jgi:stage III sporulation protein AD|nr:stage III sporulation protein AD [Clostridiales bacterium]